MFRIFSIPQNDPYTIAPAAIAGVHGRHAWAAPSPWVETGSTNGWRKLAWGKPQL